MLKVLFGRNIAQKMFLKNLPRSSPPQVTSRRQDRKSVDLAKSMWRCTSKQLNAEWSKYELKVCARTVRNRLNDKGYHFCKAETKPYMTQQHKKSHLQGARNYINAGLLMIGRKLFSMTNRTFA